MSTTQKVMFITRPNNWKRLSSGFHHWPLKMKEARTARNLLSIGDEILVYISKKSAITGILKVTDELKQLDEPIMFDRNTCDYDYVLPVHYQTILEDHSIINIKEFLGELDLTKKRQENWGSLFQKSLIRLSYNDFDFLKSKIQFPKEVN